MIDNLLWWGVMLGVPLFFGIPIYEISDRVFRFSKVADMRIKALYIILLILWVFSAMVLGYKNEKKRGNF